MGRFTTGLFTPKQPKPKYLTTMICIDCNNLWEATRLNRPCPKCASNEVIAASRWFPAKYGSQGAKHKGAVSNG